MAAGRHEGPGPLLPETAAGRMIARHDAMADYRAAASSRAAAGPVETIGVEESVGIQGCTFMTGPSVAMNRRSSGSPSPAVEMEIGPGTARG
jgi:hypothetical protein